MGMGTSEESNKRGKKRARRSVVFGFGFVFCALERKRCYFCYRVELVGSEELVHFLFIVEYILQLVQTFPDLGRQKFVIQGGTTRPGRTLQDRYRLEASGMKVGEGGEGESGRGGGGGGEGKV